MEELELLLRKKQIGPEDLETIVIDAADQMITHVNEDMTRQIMFLRKVCNWSENDILEALGEARS